MSSTFGGVISGVGGAVAVPGLTSQDLVFLALIIITLLILWWIVGGVKGKPSEAVIPFLRY